MSISFDAAIPITPLCQSGPQTTVALDASLLCFRGGCLFYSSVSQSNPEGFVYVFRMDLDSFGGDLRYCGDF